MDLHQNAALTLRRREALTKNIIDQVMTLNAAAAAFKVSAKTARKWVRRYREQGPSGLRDRSSRPLHSPHRTQTELSERVLTLRRERWTGVRIAHHTGLSRATVSRLLRRHKLSRIRDLEPRPPVCRYEHPHPGDLLHIDTKKLARFLKPGHRVTGNPQDETRGTGYEIFHVAIDDHSRIAFTELRANERAASAVAFLRAAVTYYARLGIRIRRLLTDNAPCYHSDALALTCQQLGIRHRFTRPYTPRTNGKAERFIQTALREWAYARSYDNSDQRAAQLDPWLHQYNWHRPHASLGQSPPITRSGLAGNNVLRHDI